MKNKSRIFYFSFFCAGSKLMKNVAFLLKILKSLVREGERDREQSKAARDVCDKLIFVANEMRKTYTRDIK
jgi:hypothetical protein